MREYGFQKSWSDRTSSEEKSKQVYFLIKIAIPFLGTLILNIPFPEERFSV